MPQEHWQEQLNQFIASLPQLFGLAISLGALGGVIGSFSGTPASLSLLPATQKKAPTKPPLSRRKPGRDEVKVETWFERDRAFVGVRDVKTGEFIIQWWDDDVRQLFEDGFLRSGKDFAQSVLNYAEHLGVLASSQLQAGNIRKSHPVLVYGAWLWEAPPNITESALKGTVPGEDWSLVHMAPGRFHSLDEVKDRIPRWRLRKGGAYILAIGKGDHFEAEIIRG